MIGLTEALGLIGAITGVPSLAIIFFKYRKDRPLLKIEPVKREITPDGFEFTYNVKNAGYRDTTLYSIFFSVETPKGNTLCATTSNPNELILTEIKYQTILGLGGGMNAVSTLIDSGLPLKIKSNETRTMLWKVKLPDMSEFREIRKDIDYRFSIKYTHGKLSFRDRVHNRQMLPSSLLYR